MKKKGLLNMNYPFFRCFNKGHKTTKSKSSEYSGVQNEGELNDKINTYLSKIYPAHYGKYYKLSYRKIWRCCFRKPLLQTCVNLCFILEFNDLISPTHYGKCYN